jgi:hypothetical protein
VTRHRTPSAINRTTKIIGAILPTIALVGAFVAYKAQPQHNDPAAGIIASYHQHILAPGGVATGGPHSGKTDASGTAAKTSKTHSTASPRQSSTSPTGFAATSPASASTTSSTNVAADMDYASGGYGMYSSAALSDPHIHGVIINMNWSNVERTQGNYNWTPLNNELAAWSKAGKRVAIAVRFTAEVGGAGTTRTMLPGWEQARIPTFVDTTLNSIIPDYFNATFQSDWKAFVGALGAQLQASPYKGAISYVRIATGLGGESWPVMPRSYSADMPRLKAWGYTPAAWEAWQKDMLSYYYSVLPSGVHDIYSIVKLDTNPSTGNPIQLDVAKWATANYGFGVGEEAIPSGSFGSGAGWADINTICDWVHANYPNAYIQFQTAGPLSSTAEENGIINNAEAHWARSIEWYESGVTNSADQPGFDAFQNWVDSNF